MKNTNWTCAVIWFPDPLRGEGENQHNQLELSLVWHQSLEPLTTDPARGKLRIQKLRNTLLKIHSYQRFPFFFLKPGVGQNTLSTRTRTGCGARSTSLWSPRNFWQVSRDGNLRSLGVSGTASPKPSLGAAWRASNATGQRKCCMDNVKGWTSLPIPKLLTVAPCRYDWKKSLLNRPSCPHKPRGAVKGGQNIALCHNTSLCQNIADVLEYSFVSEHIFVSEHSFVSEYS